MRTKSMTIKNNELYIGNVNLRQLAYQYGTPLYVYDEMGIKHKMNIFQENFQSEMFKCDIVYASKAFIAPYLCKLLQEKKFYIDAVSIGDLYLMEKSNFPMNYCLLHGNNKTNEELLKAIEYDVEYIVVDNITELSRLVQIVEERKKKAKILIRINPGIHANTHAYIETSLLDSKFGESIHDTEIIAKMLKICADSPYIVFDGFHAHIGSQISSIDSFIAEAKTMLNFIENVEAKYNIKINTLNLGGGFAIKYLNNDIDLDLPETLSRIVSTVENAVTANKVHIKRLMIEPGRALVGDSGVTLYKCGGKKTTFAGKKYVFVDGGMADNIRPALYDAKYTVEVASRVIAEEKELYDVVGKCCESGDIIAKDVELSELHKGDILIVYSTGAYCYSMAMNYNGLVRGGVIFIEGNKVKEVIRRQTLDELVSTCVFMEEKDENV